MHPTLLAAASAAVWRERSVSGANSRAAGGNGAACETVRTDELPGTSPAVNDLPSLLPGPNCQNKKVAIRSRTAKKVAIARRSRREVFLDIVSSLIGAQTLGPYDLFSSGRIMIRTPRTVKSVSWRNLLRSMFLRSERSSIARRAFSYLILPRVKI